MKKVFFATVIILGLAGCEKSRREAGRVGEGGQAGRPADGTGRGEKNPSGGGLSYVPDELVGSFETREQAEGAAELYGIELDSYNYEVAVFKCDGDPKELLALGEKNGWPELSLNWIYTAYE